MTKYDIYNYNIVPRNQPLFASPRRSNRAVGRIAENIQEYGSILLKYHSRHGKVPLQSVDLVAELLRQIRHVCPFLDFLEELYQAENKNEINLCNNSSRKLFRGKTMHIYLWVVDK